MKVYAIYLNFPDEGWSLRGLFKTRKLVDEQWSIFVYTSEWDEKDVKIEKIEVVTDRSQVG